MYTCLLLVALYIISCSTNKPMYLGNIQRSSRQRWYPRVTSFDALKQSTDICAHRITFSSRKNIILNKLSCFSIKAYFLGGQKTSFLFKLSLSTSVRVPPSLFWQTLVSTPFIGCWRKRYFHCSPVFTECTLYCTRTTKDYRQFITKI